MAASLSTYHHYRVDAVDYIVWVDERWLAFAAENGAPEITKTAVLGRLLWDFIDGDDTRRLYMAVHTLVRQRNESVVVPFRCDSPTLKRYMRAAIQAGDNDALEYETTLLQAEPQPEQSLIDARSHRTDSTLTVCSCCRRALLEPVGWLETDEVSTRLHLSEGRYVPQLRYTVCPTCTDAANGSTSNGHAA